MSDTAAPSREDDYPGDWFVVRRPFEDSGPVVVAVDIRRRTTERETWAANMTAKSRR